MIRTQIYLPEDLFNEAKLFAQASGKKFSHIVREGLEAIVKKGEKKSAAWKNFIGAYKGKIGKSGLELIKEYYEDNVV